MGHITFLQALVPARGQDVSASGNCSVQINNALMVVMMDYLWVILVFLVISTLYLIYMVVKAVSSLTAKTVQQRPCRSESAQRQTC